MAEYSDSLGRPGDSGRHSVEELRSMITSSIKKPMPPMPEKEKSDSDIAELARLMRGVTDNLDDVIAADRELIDSLKNGGQGGGTDEKGFAKVLSPLEKAQGSLVKAAQAGLKGESSIWKDERNAYKAMLHKGSIWVRDPYILDALKAMSNNTGTAGPIDFIPQQQIDENYASIEEHTDNLVGMAHRAGDRFLQRVQQATALFIGGSFLGSAFKDIFSGEMNMMQSAREVAFVTEGITARTEHLQLGWQEVGDVVTSTGKSLSKFQKIYIKNLKSGYKTQADTLKVTKTSVGLATTIGANAETSADMFQKWHLSFALSNVQLQQMARGMRNVARNVGLTGDAMLEAVKSSEDIMMNLRNSAQFSSQAAENIMTGMATAIKLGVEKPMSEFMSAMTGGINFVQAKGGTLAALMQSGNIGGGTDLMNKLRLGEVPNDPQDLKNLATGFEGLIVRLSRGRLKDVSEESINSLDSETKFQLDNIISAMTNGQLRLGEVSRLWESLNEQGKTFSERYGDINEKLRQGALTTQEHMHLTDRRSQMEIDKELKLLNIIGEEVHKSGQLSESMKKINDPKHLDALQTLLGSKAGGTSKEKTEALLMKAMQGLNKQVEKFDVEDKYQLKPDEIEAALSDPKQYRTLLEKMGETEQAIAVAQKTQADPMSKIQYELDLLNQTMRDFTRPALNWLGVIAGSTGIIAAQIMAATALWTASNGAHMALGANNLSNSMVGSKMTDKIKDLWAGRNTMAGTAATGIRNRMGLDANGVYGGGSKLMKGLMGIDIGGIFRNKIGKTFTSTMRFIPGLNKAVVAMEGMGTVGSTLATTLGIAGSSMAAFVGVVAGIAVAVGALGTAMISSFMAGKEAWHIFGVEQNQVTMSMRMSAEEAGFMTGVLNFLTLGFFREQLGPTGTWTQAVAKFLEGLGPIKYMIPVLGQLLIVIDALMFAFKIFWGVLKGTYLFYKEIFLGIWDGFMEAVKPVIEVWDYLVEEVMNAIGPMDDASNWFYEMGGIVGVISKGMQWMGREFGDAFRIIGKAIGTLLKYGVPIMKWMIDKLIFVINVVKHMVQTVYGWFAWLYDVLIGHSIIPDLIYGIIKFFAMLPIRVLTLIGNLIFDIIKFFATLPGKILSGLWEMAKKIPGLLWDGIKLAFDKAIEMSVAFDGFLSTLFDGMTKTLASVWDWFISYVKGEQAANEIDRTNKKGLASLGKTEEIVLDRIAKAESPQEKLAQLKEHAKNLETRLQGAEKNLKSGKEELGWDMSWMGGWLSGDAAIKKNVSGDEALIRELKGNLKNVKSQIENTKIPSADRKSQLLNDEAAKAMTTPGSAYVHDIHCEQILRNIQALIAGESTDVFEGEAARFRRIDDDFGRIQPASTPDIHRGMEQQAAGAQPMVAVVASDELTKLAAKADAQHATMKEQLSELKNILAALNRSEGSTLQIGDTMANIVGPMSRLGTAWPQTFRTSAQKQSPSAGGEDMG